MKWRDFGRTPQWVRLSEWLGRSARLANICGPARLRLELFSCVATCAAASDWCVAQHLAFFNVKYVVACCESLYATRELVIRSVIQLPSIYTAAPCTLAKIGAIDIVPNLGAVRCSGLDYWNGQEHRVGFQGNYGLTYPSVKVSLSNGGARREHPE